MSKILKNIYISNEILIKKIDTNYLLTSELGNLYLNSNNFIDIIINNRCLQIIPKNINKKTKKIFGTLFSILNSNILGLIKKFEKKLLIIGIGYRAYIEANNLILILGFSHPINYLLPNDVKITCKQNEILISGINKQRVGQVSAEIRSFRIPDVYKGKGIRYSDEKIRIKEFKKK